jgi:hypothetical protein
MGDTAVKRRPFGVTLVVILAYFEAIVTIGTGLILLFNRSSSDVQLFRADEFDKNEILWISLVVIAVGVVMLLVAGALRMGHEWARAVVGILVTLSLVSHVFVMFRSLYGLSVLSSVIAVAFDALILYLLFNREASEFFTASDL